MANDANWWHAATLREFATLVLNGPQPSVNRKVQGSNPCSGAKLNSKMAFAQPGLPGLLQPHYNQLCHPARVRYSLSARTVLGRQLSARKLENERLLKGRSPVREGTITREMWGTRALVALGAIATFAVILWAILIIHAHPVGLQYYYLVVFPNLITLLGFIAFAIVIVKFARRRRDLYAVA